MKKRIAISTAVIGLCYVVFSSFSIGAGQNCTGAKGAVTNCSGGACHGYKTGSSAYINVTSSGGGHAGSYTPGATYTITIGAAGTASLPKFGFQFTAVKGSGTAQTPAGDYTAFPINVTSNFYSGLRFVEHTAGINAASPGVYEQSFQWVAPASGTGLVTMYLTLLAVNGNNAGDTFDVSNNVSITLPESGGTAVSQTVNEHIHFTAYPNPVNNVLHISIDGGEPGSYTISVYDLNGRLMARQNADINNALSPQSVNTAAWPQGMYNVVVEKDGVYRQVAVVK